VEEVGLPDTRRHFQLVRGFLRRALDEFHKKVEESCPAFRVMQQIYEARDSLTTIRGRDSKSFEVEFVPADAEVFDDVGDDPAGHVAGMPCEGDKAVGAERVGIMAMAAGSAEKFAADFLEAAFQLPAVP